MDWTLEWTGLDQNLPAYIYAWAGPACFVIDWMGWANFIKVKMDLGLGWPRLELQNCTLHSILFKQSSPYFRIMYK